METSHQKFHCGIAAEYGGLFCEDPAATIWKGEFAVVTVFTVLSGAKAMVFPILGGVLHVP